jgi:hypothetical protein
MGSIVLPKCLLQDVCVPEVTPQRVQLFQYLKNNEEDMEGRLHILNMSTE